MNRPVPSHGMLTCLHLPSKYLLAPYIITYLTLRYISIS